MHEIVKKTNHKSKDSLFTDLFRDVKYQKKLYYALYGEEEELSDSDFKLITLEHIFVRNFYNDLGLLVKNKLILLVEAQSSYNPNMSLRFLLYIAHTYQNYIKENSLYLYGQKKVKLPTPSFYLIYTGGRQMKEEDLRLSELYDWEEEPALELRVKLITLENVKENIIREYLLFCKVLDEKRVGAKTDEELLKAIRRTLAFCKDHNILKEYLTTKEKEVEEFMLEIFTEEELENMRQKYEEGERLKQFESGKELGQEIGKEIGKKLGEKLGEARGKEETTVSVAKKMRMKGLDLQLIMELTGLSRDRILTL